MLERVLSRPINRHLAIGVRDRALEVSTGKLIAASPHTDTLTSFRRDNLQVATGALPKTYRQRQLDKIQEPFSVAYEKEEYANPTLGLMGLFELRAMLRGYGLLGVEQGNYSGTPLLGKKFLVAGAGPGREVVALGALGADVTGFDITRGYLDIAAGKVAKAEQQLGTTLNVNLIQSPAESFDFGDKDWDGISSLFGVLNHTENYGGIIQSMSQGLAPGGVLMLSMYGSHDALIFQQMRELPYKPAIVQRRVEGGILLGDTAEFLPATFPRPEEIIDTIRSSNLEVEKIYGFLRLAAFFPKNPTPENLAAFKRIIVDLDPTVADDIEGYSTPEELLLTTFIHDISNNSNLDDFAYVGFATRKENK